MLEIGSVFDGKYKILEEIGRGGMSLVYLARNERANKTWAIKELQKSSQEDYGGVGQRLVAEAEMLRSFDHPHIVRIVDVVENADKIYIVMDYIQGQDLLSVVRTYGALRPELVIRWMKQLCEVLWYLHSRQPPVIYRDMKPANVMLKPDGDVVVIDFGTARECRGGSSEDTVYLGTRGYAAPEQFGGRGETDERTDIYTLGTTMYHLLTGCTPADTDFVLYPVGELRPELKDSGIEKVVAKCCELRRENRYQSAAELFDALTRVHDFDLEVIKRDRKRLRIFLVPVILCLLGVLAMIGFRTAKERMIQNTYERSLRRAQNAETFEDAFQDFRKALSIQPEEPSGYEAVLGKIVNDRDREFSANDRRLLRELLMTKPLEDEERTCREIFEQNKPAEYDRFRFRLGEMYFQYFGSGSYQYAAEELQGLQESPYLSERERNLSESLYLISCVVQANVSGLGSSRVFGETGKGWTEVCTKFMDVLGDPEAAGEKCGNKGAAFAMYRTFANLVESRIKNFRDAGVTGEQIRPILAAGERYVQKEEGGETDQVVRKEAKEALKRARMTVRTAFGGSETEKGGSEDGRKGSGGLSENV